MPRGPRPGCQALTAVLRGVAFGLAVVADVLRSGGSGGYRLYVALALIGMSMASAFSPLMTSVLLF